MTTLPKPSLSTDLRDRLLRPGNRNGKDSKILSQTTQNPSIQRGQYKSAPSRNTNGLSSDKDRVSNRRYYAAADDGEEWPPELSSYNMKFARALDKIKRRHDSVVTTVGKTNFKHSL